MRLRSSLSALGLLAFISSSATLQAAPVEFATFNLVTANQPFSFTNNVLIGAFAATNVAVLFDFTAQSGLSTTDHAATLNITGSTFIPASGGSTLDQPVGDIQVSTLSILENSTGKNLLTVRFSGDITGAHGGTTASLAGADTAGKTVVFSSDFGTFTPPGNSYNLGLTTVNPQLSIGPGGYLNSFVSNINGSFSANFTPAAPAVPEPGSIALLTGLSLTGATFLRRRKVARNAA